jgi:hypothetical protein
LVWFAYTWFHFSQYLKPSSPLQATLTWRLHCVNGRNGSNDFIWWHMQCGLNILTNGTQCCMTIERENQDGRTGSQQRYRQHNRMRFTQQICPIAPTDKHC